MKKIKIVLLIIVLLIPLSIASLFVVFPILNNISLSKFEKQFERYPLPEETSLIEVKSVVGKLNGNGNSIDFFVGLLIQSELSKDELTHYYEHAQYAGAKVEKRNVLIEVLTVEDRVLHSKYLEHRQLKFNKLENINDFSNYYFVTIYDGGYPALFDIRGN
ncbi:hypothetical protein [Paenibacillus camelliae]|uniref:hypothetical protein n=1 Tax=Paenibacillus camelliae TaxID=512410 RepID=UPI00203CCA3A|nr:hypothetical protein [Paenibacillus camelliae]